MNKILLVSMSRCGTSHLSNEINNVFMAKNKKYIPINQELLNSLHWHDKSSHIYTQLKLQLMRNGYEFYKTSKKDTEIENTILRILKETDQYVFKYSGGEFEDFINRNKMLELANELKLKIVYMYRSDIVDRVISYIIIKNYGYLDSPKDAKFSNNLYYIEEAIDTAIWGYKEFDSLYKTFSKIDNSCIIKYSDLKFTGQDHRLIFNSNITIPVSTTQIVNNKVKNKIIKILPNLKQQVLEKLKTTTLNYNENLNYILPNSI